MIQQSNLYQLLSSVEGSAPKVVKFEIDRAPVLASILKPDAISELENLPPGAIPVETKPVKLTRAEQPITFNVVALSRNIAEESTAVNQMEFGEAVAQDEQGDDDNEGEGEYE